MNVFDIVILVLLLFGFVRGLAKGFFVEVASLAALIGGVYGAIHFSFFAGNFLEESVSWSENNISLVAFAITFIAIVIVVGMVGKMLTKIADYAALGIINKIAGGIFGLLKIGLILSVIFIFFDRMNKTITFVEKETIDASVFYEPVKSIAPTIFPSIIKNSGGEEDVIDDILKEI